MGKKKKSLYVYIYIDIDITEENSQIILKGSKSLASSWNHSSVSLCFLCLLSFGHGVGQTEISNLHMPYKSYKVIFSLLQLNLLRNRINMDKVSFWMLGLRSKQIGIQQEIFRFEVSMRHLIDRNRSMTMGIGSQVPAFNWDKHHALVTILNS